MTEHAMTEGEYAKHKAKIDRLYKSLESSYRTDAEAFISSLRGKVTSRAVLCDKLENYFEKEHKSRNKISYVEITVEDDNLTFRVVVKRVISCSCPEEFLIGPRGGKLKTCKQCCGKKAYKKTFWLDFKIPCPEDCPAETFYPAPTTSETGDLLDLDFGFGFRTDNTQEKPPTTLIHDAMVRDLEGMWQCLIKHGGKGDQLHPERGSHRAASKTRMMNRKHSAKVVGVFRFNGRLHSLVYFPSGGEGKARQWHDELLWWHGNRVSNHRHGCYFGEFPSHYRHGQWREGLFQFLYEALDLWAAAHEKQLRALWEYYRETFPDAKIPEEVFERAHKWESANA